MKKTYFEPEMRIVKLHGRARMLAGSLTSVRQTSTNLGDDAFDEEISGGVFAGR
jgi:hypothetical protein